MEHLLHIFGGGCGEHLILPSIVSGLGAAWAYLKSYRPSIKNLKLQKNDDKEEK